MSDRFLEPDLDPRWTEGDDEPCPTCKDNPRGIDLGSQGPYSFPGERYAPCPDCVSVSPQDTDG